MMLLLSQDSKVVDEAMFSVVDEVVAESVSKCVDEMIG